MQGLWALIPTSPLLVVMSGYPNQEGILAVEIVGLVIWVFGFTIESIADCQKSSFNEQE